MSHAPRRRASRLSPAVVVMLRLYSRITRQQRARVLVRDQKGNVLLVWERIGLNRWGLAGGGIKRGELPVEAAARELGEELGLICDPGRLEFVGFFARTKTGIGYDAHVFVVTIAGMEASQATPKSLELVDVRWFPADALPSPLSPFVRLALERLSKSAII